MLPTRDVNSTSQGECSTNWGDLVEEEEKCMSTTQLIKDELLRMTNVRNELSATAENHESFYAQLDERIKESAAFLDTHRESALREDKVCYWKTRGAIFMASPTFASQAVDALTKAVKLDPAAFEYWNYLGDMYCTLKDYELSKKCFLSALEQKKNPVSLQNLSKLLRKKNDRGPKDVEDGINYAKEALALDFTDIKSWTVLGNAYLAASFSSVVDESLLKKALHAYRQAEKGGPEDIETCTNKFVALKFLEYYEEALKSLLPSFYKPDVDWKQMKADYLDLIRYLKDIQELVDKKGKIRPKKLLEYTKQMADENAKKAKSPVSSVEGESSQLSGKIIWILSPDGTYPYTLGMLTGSEEVIVVTIFNLRRDKSFRIGDKIAVPAADRVEIDFTINENTFKFTKTRVFLPTLVQLNGKKLTATYCNPFVITSD